MTEEQFKYYPGVVRWLQHEHKALEDVEKLDLERGMRQLTQEETNFSPVVQHTTTGLIYATVTMRDSSQLTKTFTQQEFQQKDTHPSDDSPTKK